MFISHLLRLRTNTGVQGGKKFPGLLLLFCSNIMVTFYFLSCLKIHSWRCCMVELMYRIKK